MKNISLLFGAILLYVSTAVIVFSEEDNDFKVLSEGLETKLLLLTFEDFSGLAKLHGYKLDKYKIIREEKKETITMSYVPFSEPHVLGGSNKYGQGVSYVFSKTDHKLIKRYFSR